MVEARDIHVTGIVQGVGFRPFIYRLARRYLVNGWVLNATDGVHIHAEGEEQLLDGFILEISSNAPAAARVDQIDIDYVPLQDCETFEIRFSEEDEVEKTTLISPDLATCDDCLAELFNPSDRRYHYPFINCTNCGPRFTIIDALPYDRAATSMAEFEMCEACAGEYADPADRRYHAQPNACFECGPQLSFAVLADTEGQAPAATPRSAAQASPSCASLLHASTEAASQPEENSVQRVAAGACPSASDSVEWATTREESDVLIERVVEMLRAGKIVAVKGLGGFHLVCDAANADTLAELRRRKQRPGKAFAVMVRDVETVHHYCHVSEEEEALLSSPARPIVLLRKRSDVQFAPGLADKLPELGVMLPATPVQHLLVRAFDGMLVMTSGNVHDEPIQIDDDEARVALRGIADAFLGNNRAIRSRYDDSVVRVLDLGHGESMVQVIRRARGYTPLPLTLPATEEVFEGTASAASADAAPIQSVFATGPEQKCTFCHTREGEAFVSQHIGDMENAETNDAWLEAKTTYERLLQLTPARVACDKHPEYLTSKWAHAQDFPVVEVQHHHAHIVSAMAENQLTGPVCGIAFDGTGYGEDGAIWGGEVLLSNLQAFERFANFAYIPLPGGAAAIQHPLRCAYGVLWAYDLLEHPAAAQLLDALGPEAEICQQMIEGNLNTPYTSSVGRLFDAASALLGVCTQPSYEGEGAILLEAALDPASDEAHAYPIDFVKNTATKDSTAQDTSVVLLDAAPLFAALLDDMQAGVEVARIAQRFHNGLVAALVQVAQLVHAAYDINTVVLSGGVFMNRYVMEHVVPALAHAGFTVAVNRDLPPNDACISYGQAVVATHTPQ